MSRALGVLVLSCASCWYDIADPSATTTTGSGSSASGGASVSGSGAAVSGGSGTGSAGSGGSGGSDGPGCPQRGCPTGSHCDDAEAGCVVEPQPVCGTHVFVEHAVRFLGDTCDGLDIQGCGGSTTKHLMFQLGGTSSWDIAATGQIGDMNVNCDGGQLGCGTRQTLPKGTFVTVKKPPSCGSVVIDMVPN